MTWEHGRVGNGNLAAPGVGRGQMPGRFGAEPHLPGQRAQGKGQRANNGMDGIDTNNGQASARSLFLCSLGIALLTGLIGGFFSPP